MWVIISLVVLAIIFWFMGWSWERNLRRPALASIDSLPLVSILIPAYKSEATIRECIESAKAIDYPKKEIFVVNDFPDNTPNICREMGVTCIQGRRRQGKALALNKAAKKTKGEILFFLDSDTTASPDCLKKLIPWFSQKDIAAVAPKYVVKNRDNFLTRLISLENQFINSFFKIHMFFGSLVSFRGCGVAIRRDVFEKMGGWPKTLIEDTDLSARILADGYRIQFEPSAIVKTKEPENLAKLNRQRFRWGKGSLFSFIRHRKTYRNNSQFILYFLPYILLCIALLGFALWQTSLYAIPFASLLILYSFSIKEAVILGALVLSPLLSNVLSAAAGSVAHIALLTHSEKKDISDILLIIPYICFFVPAIMFFYIKGIISGIRDRKHNRSEIDFNCW